MGIIEHFIDVRYCLKIDSETGEILETRIVEKSSLKEAKSSIKKDGCSEPKLILEDNKFRLTSGAIDLMRVSPDDRIDIKYEEGGIPVIGTEEAFGTKGGTKLTKSCTCAYKGSKNAELAKYGKEFGIEPHPTKNGLFILKYDKANIEVLAGDENVNLADDIVDFNLDEMIDEIETTEVNSSFFKL